MAFGNVTYDSATGMYSADGTITVQTNGGIDDGVDGSVTVQLTHPFMCQLAGNGQATATIVHPDVTISSPSMPSGGFDVPDDGTLVEVNLSVAVGAAYAAEGNTTLQLTLPDGAAGLTFWTAQTGGTQLVPDANGVLETWEMPTSGTFDDTVWASYDSPDGGSQSSVAFGDPSLVGGAGGLLLTAQSGAAAAKVTAFGKAGDRFTGQISTDDTSRSFTDSNGVVLHPTKKRDAAAPANFMVVNATNMKDANNLNNPKAASCWVQFFYYTVSRTDTGPNNQSQMRAVTNRFLSSDKTSWYYSTVNPNQVKWYVDNGGSNNTQADYASYSPGFRNTSNELAIADDPAPATEGDIVTMCQQPNSSEWGDKLANGYSVSTITVNVYFEDYLMCAGAAVAKVAWGETLTFDFATFNETQFDPKNPDAKYLAACTRGGYQYTAQTVTLNVQPNATQLGLLTNLGYPGQKKA